MEQPKASEPRWPNALLKALREAREAKAAIERVRALHVKDSAYDFCTECRDYYDDYPEKWPCATLRALDFAPAGALTGPAE